MNGHGGRRGPDRAWTDDEISLLLDLWMQGDSATEIACKLANGRTRNAVISRVHRASGPAADAARAAHAANVPAGPRKRPGATSRPVPAYEVVGFKRRAKEKSVADSHRQPPQLVLVSSVELPPAPVEKPVDLYAHMRSDDNLRRAIAAMSRPGDIRDGQAVGE